MVNFNTARNRVLGGGRLYTEFEGAWNRFSKTVNVSTIKSFNQLFAQFREWGGQHAPMTQAQTHELKLKAVENNVGTTEQKRDRLGIPHWRNVGTGRFVRSDTHPVPQPHIHRTTGIMTGHIFADKDRRGIMHYRDVKTGIFVSKPSGPQRGTRGKG